MCYLNFDSYNSVLHSRKVRTQEVMVFKLGSLTVEDQDSNLRGVGVGVGGGVLFSEIDFVNGYVCACTCACMGGSTVAVEVREPGSP